MSGKIVEANAANWKEEVLESEKLVLVEFWHPQCPYCRMIELVYSELAEEYADKLKFAKLDVMESEGNQELAARYGVMGTLLSCPSVKGDLFKILWARWQKNICNKRSNSQLKSIKTVQKRAPLSTYLMLADSQTIENVLV